MSFPWNWRYMYSSFFLFPFFLVLFLSTFDVAASLLEKQANHSLPLVIDIFIFHSRCTTPY